MHKHTLLGRIEVILSLIFISIICFLVAWKLQLITGFPKGVDAYAHLVKVIWILRNFPHINWNPYWDSGTYFWQWTYPPAGSVVTAIVAKLGVPITSSMSLVSFGSMIVLTVSLFSIIRFWTKIWIALPITLLVITTPALWSWWGHGGNYIRLWGIGWYGFSFYLFVRYLEDPTKRRYLWLVIILGISMSSHMLFGGLTIATIGLYTLFAVDGWLQKIIILGKTLGVGFLLSGYFYIPILMSTNGSRFIEPALGSAIPWMDFVRINPEFPYFSLPLVLSVLAFASILLACLVLIGRFKLERRIRAGMWVFLLSTIGTLAYMLIGHIPGYPNNGYLAVFAPFAMFPLFIIYASLLLSIVVFIVSSHVSPKVLQGGLWGLSTMLIVSFFLQDISSWKVYDVTSKDSRQTMAQSVIDPITFDPQYRFGTDSAFVADWFNWKYPDVPQTRDYIYQGIPYKQWQYFQEYVLWTQPDRYAESQWLLDWYGIKLFTVGFASDKTQYDKFSSRPDLFRLTNTLSDQNFFVYENAHSKPIISTSNARPILIVSSHNDYDIVVRIFAFAGWGTDTAIPVYANDLRLVNAQRFPTVFLYRYRIQDKDWESLKAYVEGGGRLVIESTEPDPRQQTPEWSPVKDLTAQGISDAWEFSGQTGEAGEVQEISFGPPLFRSQPWTVVTGKPVGLSRILLVTHKVPVLVSSNLGKGTVIWSGLNLPYHAESYKNAKEASLFGNLLGIVSPQTIIPVGIRVNWPEYRQWVIQKKATGLIWKETYFPNHWHLSWTDQSGKRGVAMPLPAGPNLMYVFLPIDAAYPVVLNARYQLSAVDYLGWVSTIGTGAALLLFALGKLPTIPTVVGNPLKKVSVWWRKE